MSSKRQKTRQPSRGERVRLPSRPQFPILGIITGVTGGVFISVALEAAMGRPKQVVMMICGLVGGTVGTVVEAFRFGFRYWKWKVACRASAKTNLSVPN